MTTRDSLLATVNDIRGAVPSSMGLRTHVVTVRVRSWSGGRASSGTATDVDTTLTTGDGTSNPRVQNVSSKDVLASGGVLTDQDMKVGPFTQPFALGGVAQDVTDPTTDVGSEVFFRITGPGFSDGGIWFKRLNENGNRNFQRMLFLRSMGTQTP